MKSIESISFKSIMVCMISFILIIGSSVSVSATYDNKRVSHELDIADVLRNPETYKDVEVRKYSAEEYKQVILNDNNLSDDSKTQMLEEVNDNLKLRVAYDYWTIYTSCEVNSSYTCRPYFYTYSSFGPNGTPYSIIRVQRANIDRNFNGVSKQFSGELFYNLERSNKLYWDLNDDFYNNGTTSASAGISIGVGDSTSINFSASYSSNHFAYCHKYGSITF